MRRETLDRRGLDRRGFIGAAAGAAAAGAALTSPWSRNSASAADCPEQTLVGLPRWRYGYQNFGTPGGAWGTSAQMTDYLAYNKAVSTVNWEPAGNYGYYATGNFPSTPGHTNTVFNHWTAMGIATKQYGITMGGDHGGPDGNSAANVGSAIAKSNAWNCNAWGNGGGNPSVPGSGTALTLLTGANSITSWQQTAATMNMYGWRFQNAKAPAPGGGGAAASANFNYGDGAGPVNITTGRKCARYYRHYHSESAKWINNVASQYHQHYTGEIAVNEADIHYAYGQPDMGWMLDGLWMSGGGPSVGLSTIPIVTNPASASYNRQYGKGATAAGGTVGNRIGNNVLVMPDVYERSQDFWPCWHVKDLGGNGGGTNPDGGTYASTDTVNDQGASVVTPGDNNNTATVERDDPVCLALNPNYRWARSFHNWAESVSAGSGNGKAWDQSQDTTPFQEAFSRLRDPLCHFYIVERDGASATASSNAYYKKCHEQGNIMLDSIVLDRKKVQARAPLTGATLSASYDGSAPLTGTPLPHSYPNYPWPPAVGGAATTPTESPSPGTGKVQGMDYSSNYWPLTNSDWFNSTGSSPGGGNAGPYTVPTYNSTLHNYQSDTKWRPADSAGAPVPKCDVSLTGIAQVGKKLHVEFGTWSNHANPYDNDFCYTWLRNGVPISPTNPGYLVANVMTGGRNSQATADECKCCGTGSRYYLLTPADAGQKISVSVNARNSDASTVVETDPVTVTGCTPVATTPPVVSLKRYPSGTPRKVNTTKGQWDPSGGSAVYAFERSTNNGGSWSAVAPVNVVGSSYNVPASDVDQVPAVQVRSKVTVTNSKCGTSAATVSSNVMILN